MPPECISCAARTEIDERGIARDPDGRCNKVALSKFLDQAARGVLATSGQLKGAWIRKNMSPNCTLEIDV
jgi:hypothetical protein